MAVRTRIRRKRRRKAPAVKRGAVGAQNCSEKQGSRLLIGGAHDPAEKAADSLAARALGQSAPSFAAPAAPTVVHRKCAACEARDKGEKITRQATPAPVTAPGARAAPASATETRAITSLGVGRPLSTGERSFFEPRFGADFSGVRLHDGPQATQAADSIQAEAFTHGQTIAMGRTADPVGTMAHELAHVVQGGSALRRKLMVKDPTKPFPGSAKAKKITNASGLAAYLKEFPGAVKVSIAGSGEVTLPNGVCDTKEPAKPSPKSKYPVTQGCLCQVIASKQTWEISFFADDKTGPHTNSDGGNRGVGHKSKGGKVVMNTPNSAHEYGFYKADGTVQKAADWTILAHELCGHAAKHDRNDHPTDAAAKLRHGHDEVVPITNQIRREKEKETGVKMTMRPETAAAPNCGESTFRDRGSAAKWQPSGQLARACQKKRDKFIDAMKVSKAEKARLKKIPLNKELK